MKDQIDRMKRKKVLDDQWSSDEEGSLEQPTIKKGGSGMNTHTMPHLFVCYAHCTCTVHVHGYLNVCTLMVVNSLF